MCMAAAGGRGVQAGEAGVAVTRAQAGSAQARVQQKQAALEQAQLNLQYTTVKAPVTGVVGNKTVQVGQVAQAGQQMLAIIPLDDVWVTVNFKESQLKNIRVGQRATISVDAYGGRADKGPPHTHPPPPPPPSHLPPPQKSPPPYPQ